MNLEILWSSYMTKPDYTKLRSNIPNNVKTKYKTKYDVLWQDHLVDAGGKSLHGITYFEPNQIILDTMQSDREAVTTYYHEFIHALADTYEVKLTENEVRRLEKSFSYMREFFLRLEGIE